MENLQLPTDWLERQIAATAKEVAGWPAWMRDQHDAADPPTLQDFAHSPIEQYEQHELHRLFD